jgi:hypothetical protein
MPGDFNSFSVIEGKCDGFPVVAMICSQLRGYKEKSKTPWFLGFSTALRNPTRDGLPTAREAEELNQWEDLADREVNSRCESIFVGRVTWKGHRELLYCVDSIEGIVQEIQRLIRSGTVRPFAFRFERDAEWANVSLYF